jgi:outer membrane lipoprotein SlyB
MSLKRNILIGISALSLLAGCTPPGADLQANVYQAGQVNQQQAAEVVTILSISPAKVEVDNAQAQRTAQVGGTILGAVLGGVLGNNMGSHNGLAGGVVGGVAGATAGSLVPGTTMVDGVTLGYSEGGNLLTSTQVGEMCQFAPGKSLVVSTQANETRIQPNAVCPPSKNT